MLSGPAGREISPLPLAPSSLLRPRSALGWPRLRAQLMSHPLRTPRPPPTPAEARLLHFGFPETREPAGGAASCARPARSIAAAGSRLGLRRSAPGPAPAAARGQMAAGTRGAKKGEVGELKPAPGLDFCLLSKSCARRGEAQPARTLPRGLGSRTGTAGSWLIRAGPADMPLLHSRSCPGFVATYLLRVFSPHL